MTDEQVKSLVEDIFKRPLDNIYRNEMLVLEIYALVVMDRNFFLRIENFKGGGKKSSKIPSNVVRPNTVERMIDYHAKKTGSREYQINALELNYSSYAQFALIPYRKYLGLLPNKTLYPGLLYDLLIAYKLYPYDKYTLMEDIKKRMEYNKDNPVIVRIWKQLDNKYIEGIIDLAVKGKIRYGNWK